MSQKSQSNINLDYIKINRSYFDDISFFAKQFCIPKQIKLVDYDTNRQNHQLKENIQIVERIGPLDNSPLFRDIAEVNFSDENIDAGDGLISLVKNLSIKIAICVTVYSEQKFMLKRTLAGIKKNYDIFFKEAGIHSHQIIVVIIFDGIQKMNTEKQSDKNMINLFRQFDLINGFRKKQYILAKQKQDGILGGEMDITQQSKINQIQNFTDQMVFTEEQYEILEQILLQNQYKRYKQMRQLISFAEDLQKNKLNNTPIQMLPEIVRDAFSGRARQYLSYNGIQDITEDNLQLQHYVIQNFPQQKIDTLKLQALKDSVFLAKQYIKSRENTALMYQMGLPIQDSQQENAKINLFAVVKYVNKGKLSSHLWFFQGFCSMTNPSVCILLDCGLEPKKDAIFKMWSHIETYKQTCGGVCGYMKLRKQSPYDEAGKKIEKQAQSCITSFSNLIVDIQKAQIFEYHFAHLLDKPFESLTGYIHVLPGAFSGYNWDALKSEKFKMIRSDGQIFQKDIEKRSKQQILKKYLKTVIYNEVIDDISEANMYLAQDRILCLQIYTKKKNRFNLEYLPNSQAIVDPIITIPKLISQRKRWINGSWFALDFVLRNKNRVSDSNHNCWDKLWFHFNMYHAEIMRWVSYLSITFFFVTLHLMMLQFSQTTLKNYFMQAYNLTEQQLVFSKIFNDFFSIRSLINSTVSLIDILFIICIGIAVYRALTIKQQQTQSKRSFNTISSWLGVFGLFSIILIFSNFILAVLGNQSELINLDGTFTQQTFIYLLMAIVGSHVIIVLSAFNCKTYYEILTCLPSFFFYLPSYINLFIVYAFCRIDDLSWGTKGLETEQKAKQNAIRIKFSDEKIKFTIKWLGFNIILSLILVGLANDYVIQNYIIWLFSAYFGGIMAIKVIFVVIFFLKYNIITRFRVSRKIKELREKNENRNVQEDKKRLNKFIERMKQQQIDQHLQHINQQIVKKHIFQQAYKLQKQRKSKGKTHQNSNHRVSFKQLKRISLANKTNNLSYD